eukprot:gene23847-32234_t
MGKLQQTYLMLLDNCSSMTSSPTTSSPELTEKYKYTLDDNKYLFALSCFGLDKIAEAERALLSISLSNISVSKRLLKSSILHLLGKICRRQHRREVAVEYFMHSLKVDPFMWSSITELSELGVNMDLAGFIHSGQKDVPAPVAAKYQSKYNSKLLSMEVVETLSNAVSTNIEYEQSADSDRARFVMSHVTVDTDDATMQLPATRASMSLGLSSLSLRVPFSSPFGGMPSPIHSVDTGGAFARGELSHQNIDHSIAADAVSHLDIDRSTSFAGNMSGDLTYSHLSSSGVGADPRATLFGLPTPADHSINVSTPPRRDSKESSPLHSTAQSGLTQDLMMTRLSVPTTGRDSGIGISGVRQRLNPSSTQSKAPHSTAQSYNRNNASIRQDGAPERHAGGGRRVSFGPTARLSFGLGQVDKSHFQPSPSHGSTYNLSSSGSGSIDMHFTSVSSSSMDLVTQSQSGEQKLAVREEDEHPFKLQRKGSASTKGGQFGADSGSSSSDNPPPPPLAPAIQLKSATVVSQSKLPSRSPFPVESSPIPTEATTYPATLPHSSPRSGVELLDGKQSQQKAHAAMKSKSGGYSSVNTEAAEKVLANIVNIFARAYQLLCAYRCRDCVNVLHELPLSHFRSALVSQMIGKAYYELNEYKPAVLALREMLKLEPFRVQGLDTLSTALWHLKKDKELCALAQQVSEIDKFCPETWCVVGNCFSLQKEPDTAIRFFQRALQIDPTYTYAHTLCGHEQVNNEDMEKAVTSFRAAILCNDRHYNAWYGLGTIFFRQERFELSEYHFRRAIQINPNSSVLHCYLAMTLHAQGSTAKTAEALEVLHKACDKDPKNPQLRFQLAHILVSVEDLEGALKALLLVKEIAPKEPPVHALLGQVYHRLGPKYISLCLRHLNIAMDLDPKEASSLKAILEHIDEPMQ